MKITWIITYISPISVIGKDPINKQVLCVEEQSEDQYPNRMAIDFLKDKTDLLIWLKIWDIVEVMLNYSYNRFEKDGKESIFNSIRWWKVNIIKSVEKQAEIKKEKEANNDLPF